MNIPNYNYDFNNANISMTGKGGNNKGGKKFFEKIWDKIPKKELKNNEKIQEKRVDLNKFLGSPHGNRFVIGVTALCTQPLIDSMNKRVDEDTKKVSVHRTIAKIIAGTLVGCAVRAGFYYLFKNHVSIDGRSKLNKILVPQEYIPRFRKSNQEFDNYKNAVSTILALITMGCFTNFVFDAPLTRYLTNRFNACSKEKEAQKREEVIYA